MKLTTGLVAILTFAFLAIVGCIVILIITGHDGTAFIGLVVSLLTSISGFVILFSKQHEQGKDVATIKGNTNGTLSALQATNAAKDAQLKAALALLSPDDAQQVLDTTLSRDEVMAAVRATVPNAAATTYNAPVNVVSAEAANG